MKKIKYPIVTFLVLIGVWQLGIVLSGINIALFPSPKMVVIALKELITNGLPGSSQKVLLHQHILISIGRFLTGYILAAITAILLGLFLGLHPKVFAYINPLFQLIRPVAPVAFMPFIVLLFGIGNVPAIVIIFIAGFFPIVLSVVSATVQVNPVYKMVALNYELSKTKTAFTVILPSILPQVVNSLHLAIGTTWIFLVSGEMVGAQSGLGFLIMDAKNCIRMDSLLATILVIGVIGLLLDEIVKIIEKSLGIQKEG